MQLKFKVGDVTYDRQIALRFVGGYRGELAISMTECPFDLDNTHYEVDLTPEQVDELREYLGELPRWGARMRLKHALTRAAVAFSQAMGRGS